MDDPIFFLAKPKTEEGVEMTNKMTSKDTQTQKVSEKFTGQLVQGEQQVLRLVAARPLAPDETRLAADVAAQAAHI